MHRLFDAAKALNALIPERALRAAASYIEEQLPGSEIHRADAVRCVELAGVFQSYELAGAQSETIPVVNGRGSSTASFLKQEYLRAIDPAVRQVRNHYFGQETAPFLGDYAAATEWLDSGRKDEEQLNKPTLEKEKQIERLRDTVREMAEELEELTGGAFTVDPAWRKDAAHYEDADGRVQLFGGLNESPLLEFAELTLAVARATGFQEPDVVRHVLCGEEPPLHRAIGQYGGLVGRVGDARIDRAEVKLTILAPDLSQADLQKIRAFVRKAWTPRGGDPPLRFEDEDKILRTLIIELGGGGRRRRKRGFWPDLLARWKEEVEDPEATVAQLKMREQRLQRKLRQLRGETTP